MSWRGIAIVAIVIGLLLVLVWEATGPRQVAAAADRAPTSPSAVFGDWSDRIENV